MQLNEEDTQRLVDGAKNGARRAFSGDCEVDGHTPETIAHDVVVEVFKHPLIHIRDYFAFGNRLGYRRGIDILRRLYSKRNCQESLDNNTVLPQTSVIDRVIAIDERRVLLEAILNLSELDSIYLLANYFTTIPFRRVMLMVDFSTSKKVQPQGHRARLRAAKFRLAKKLRQ